MERPLVSIVIRTCPGRSGMASEAVTSAIAQTWRPLEIVVVEDGGATAKSWLNDFDVRGTNLVHLPLGKGGRCRAGNAGLQAARGALIGFLDDDDRLHPEHIAVLTDALLRRSDCVAAYSIASEVPTIIDDWLQPVYHEQPSYVAHQQPYSREILQRRNFLPIQSVLFQRSLFERLGGFSVELDQLEDWDLWRRYSAAGDFCFVPRVTSMYRVPGTAAAAYQRHLQLHRYASRLTRQSRIDSSHSGPPSFHVALRGAAKSLARRCLLANRWTYQGYWHVRQLYYRSQALTAS